MNWRKINRVLHRDFGYFFAATSIIYALSGIALNHLNDWNPNYVITTRDFQVSSIPDRSAVDKSFVLDLLDKYDNRNNYKKHYFPSNDILKVFLKGGSVYLNLTTGKCLIEKIRKRHVFYEVNYLHYNPGVWWTWFSDIYAGALALLAITGLFILRGKNGITGRGLWLTVAGVIFPLILLYFVL